MTTYKKSTVLLQMALLGAVLSLFAAVEASEFAAKPEIACDYLVEGYSDVVGSENLYLLAHNDSRAIDDSQGDYGNQRGICHAFIAAPICSEPLPLFRSELVQCDSVLGARVRC